MLSDLKELYSRKSSLLAELEKIDKQIFYLEQPESLTQERMEMLEKKARKRNNISNIKTILSLVTTSIAIIKLIKVVVSK